MRSTRSESRGWLEAPPLTGDWKTASRHAALAAALSEPKLQQPADYESNRAAAYALATSFEVQAQVLAASGNKDAALHFLEERSKASASAPYNFRARLWKQWNLIGLKGRRAPAFDWGPPAGKPVVLFLWAEWCGDCKDQSPVFKRIVEKYAPKGVAFIAPTRLYTEEHEAEKARVEQTWRQLYAGTQPVPHPPTTKRWSAMASRRRPRSRLSTAMESSALFAHADD